MEVLIVRTFDQHVHLASQLSPHALILDWGRRREHAQRQYFETTSPVTGCSAQLCERRIAQDQRLDPGLAATIQSLCLRRNAVAHESHTTVTGEEASAFASQVIGALGELGHVL